MIIDESGIKQGRGRQRGIIAASSRAECFWHHIHYAIELSIGSVTARQEQNSLQCGLTAGGRDDADNPCDPRCVSARVIDDIRTKHQIRSLTFHPHGNLITVYKYWRCWLKKLKVI